MRKQKGFSYLEVLVAVSLVTASGLIVAATMPAATNARGKAAYYDKAMSLAQKQLEAIRGLGYTNVTPTQLSSNGLLDSPYPITNTSTSSGGLTAVTLSSTLNYSFSNSDAAVGDSPANVLPSGTGYVGITQISTDLKQVTVTISYSDRGVTRSFSTGTLVANL